MSGIYIHIPFCRQACTYCDFHFSTNLSNKTALVAAMCREVDLRHGYLENKEIDSLYFGGGTPSLLTVSELEQLIHKVCDHFALSREAEVCLEVNPDDVNVSVLAEWKALGINRLSIGLQSFNEEELKWMNRLHSPREAVKAVKLAQDKGFDNLTIDLIYGTKFQTLQSWQKTLEQAVELETAHISSYNLTIEDKTVLGVNYRKGKEPAVNDELSSEQFLLMKDVLENAGFVHYEVSNFGKPGRFAKHNSNYWLQKSYLGIGPSAHSFNGTSRQWNVKSNAGYVREVNASGRFFEKEDLHLKDRYNEYVLTRLRTVWGCDLNEIKNQFGNDFALRFKEKVLTKKGLVENRNDVFVLTREGLLQADGIASDLFVV